MARNQPSPATLNLLQGKLDNPVTLLNFTISEPPQPVSGGRRCCSAPWMGGRGNTKRRKEVHINCWWKRLASCESVLP
jgi:hypothetical protein